MIKIANVLHIIWKLIFQNRVIRNPRKKVRLSTENIVINCILPNLILSSKESRNDIEKIRKSLGLSSLLVTL